MTLKDYIINFFMKKLWFQLDTSIFRTIAWYTLKNFKDSIYFWGKEQ